MAISASALAQTANDLVNQLNSQTITFQNYRDSMNSIIISMSNNPELTDPNNSSFVHDIDVAIRIASGDPAPARAAKTR